MGPRSSSARAVNVSRRTVLGAAGIASLSALLAACAGGTGSASPTATGKLNVYSWADYFSKQNLSGFKAKHGFAPKISTYDDNDTLFAKLNSSARTNYDLVVPSSGWIQVYAQKGLLEKIDHSRIPFDSLDPDLLNRSYDPHNAHSIPKDWGVYGVIYDPAVTGEIRTWDDFFAAGLKDDVQGKIRLGTSGWETVGQQLWADGVKWNTTSVDTIKAAGEKLKTWVGKAHPQFTSFDVDKVVNGSIVLAVYNQAGARTAIQQNPKLKWVVPGPTSELWVDSYAIPKGAKNLDSAYQFLDYLLTEQAQVRDTTYLGYPTALKGLRNKLPAGTKNVDLIFGGADVDLSKLQTFVVDQKTLPVYQEIQSELQAVA